jgi:hypothetical protein
MLSNVIQDKPSIGHSIKAPNGADYFLLRIRGERGEAI